jgi:riboflavin biosynthesis pyrimidine reductase
MKKLCASGVNSVLIEGGQNISTQFLRENLVDELIWIRSSKIIGNDAIAGIGEMGFVKISEVLDQFVRVEVRDSDSDLIEVFRRK